MPMPFYSFVVMWNSCSYFLMTFFFDSKVSNMLWLIKRITRNEIKNKIKAIDVEAQLGSSVLHSELINQRIETNTMKIR